MSKERPIKPRTIDRIDQRRQANAQKRPYKGNEIHKTDRGLHLNDPGQHPKGH